MDAKEIRLVDRIALSSLLTFFTCLCVRIRSVYCDHYENKALLSISNTNLLISYLIYVQN